MRVSKIICSLATVFMFETSFAGSPIPAEETCPIGGEVFEITSTPSCSSMGHTMSLKAITSCDFVTHLPVCPSNQLPMYKSFSDVEIPTLKALIETKEYENWKNYTPYYRAYLIEEKFSEPDSVAQFFVLQTGIWFDPTNTLTDTRYLEAYHKSRTKAFATDKVEDAKFWLGAEAMVFLHEARLEMARANLTEMKNSDNGENAYFTEYVEMLEKCISNYSDDEFVCEMDTPISK